MVVTGNSGSIKQQPHLTPIVQRDQIAQLIKDSRNSLTIHQPIGKPCGSFPRKGWVDLLLCRLLSFERSHQERCLPQDALDTLVLVATGKFNKTKILRLSPLNVAYSSSLACHLDFVMPHPPLSYAGGIGQRGTMN